MNKLKARREAGAVCPACKHPDYVYLGRVNPENDEWWAKNGKHQFKCVKCDHYWQYGKGDSIYLELL